MIEENPRGFKAVGEKVVANVRLLIRVIQMISHSHLASMKSGRVKKVSSDWFQLLSELPRSLALAISWAHSTIRRRPFFSPSFSAPLGVELSSIQSSSNSHCVNLTSVNLVLVA